MSPYSELHRQWMSACEVPFLNFFAAKGKCRQTQAEVLKTIIVKNAGTAYGRAYNFDRVSSVEEFQRRVPIVQYEDLQPFVERITQGEKRVLTADPIINLHLTSGTTRGSKLLPFTSGLRHAFQAGIQPWLYDLYARYPGLREGSFYWIVTPAGTHSFSKNNAVPVGFANDADYLDPVGRRIYPQIATRYQGTSSNADSKEFYRSTWLALLADARLAMISFWSPRFFLELLRHLPHCAEAAIKHLVEIKEHKRAAELQEIFNDGFNSSGIAHRLWPNLSVVSCWTEGWASLSLNDVQRFFDGILIQGKGLLATEGIVSFPLYNGAGSVLAVRSHFFEFESSDGRCFLADELKTGEQYQVLLTTQGGLYRYRLGDIVRVVGWENDIPRLEFVSKTGGVVDLCGEKLTEDHVGHVMSTAIQRQARPPAICFLTPKITNRSAGYALVLDDSFDGNLTALCADVESGLEENVYYSHARRLGQLAALEIQRLNHSAQEQYRRKKQQDGQWSTAKPSFLEPHMDWPL